MTKLGNIGENLAVKYLEAKGFKVLERNFRYKRAEIDLITQKNKLIVFVEVKARSSTAFGHPEQAVSQQQEALIQSAAEEYLITNELDSEIRFDIIAILKVGEKYKIEHFEDAF